MPDVLARLRGGHAVPEYPEWVRWATALPPLLFAVALALHTHDGARLHGAAMGLVVASVVPWILLLFFELHPLALGALVLVPQAVLHLGGPDIGIVDATTRDTTEGALFILTWMVGEVGAVGTVRQSVGVTLAAVGIIGGRWLLFPVFHAGPFWIGGIVAAGVIGLMLRRQQLMLVELRAAQEALARDAVLRERQRVAREVHDVIAHTLTVTMMHLTAARLAIGRNPASAEEALADAERLGRQSLAEIRRTVALLRAESDGSPGSDIDNVEKRPQPDADDLDALVAAYVSAGMDVDVAIDGDSSSLSPTAGLALFRILQESLANAAKHAPGARVTVGLVVTDDDVRLTVHSDGGATPPARAEDRGGGMGLVGMRERAALLGGWLRAGPDGDGWRVELAFPRAAASESTRVNQ